MKENTMIQVHEDTGIYVALVAIVGRKWVQLIRADAAGIKLTRRPKSDARYWVEIDYPVARAKRHFRKMGKAVGITKSARRALRG